jgi:hypothetical protein
MYSTFRQPPGQSFRTAKEALRWTLGLLQKCIGKIESGVRDKVEA